MCRLKLTSFSPLVSDGRYWDFLIDSIFDYFSSIFSISISILLKIVISCYKGNKHFETNYNDNRICIY